MKAIGILIFVYSSMICVAQRWSAELHFGYANNLPSRLTIKQEGYPDLSIKAKYYSEPFISPYYWLWRISYKKDEKQKFEFEAVHHKIYLKNTTNEIEAFGISHGLNLLIINHVHILSNNFHVNYGIGGVLAHAESTIRGKSLPEKGRGILGMGYYMSGAALNISFGKYFNINKRLYFNTELRFNPSYTVVPVVDGKAYVWNFAYQAIAGVGYYFIK
ncbi:MAG: hypothetical protein N2449_04930 [Bacteroidales bacterium]|nr:hypothetical protein [Bacteroidales bacterium]